jgi:aryl carrier-like protein
MNYTLIESDDGSLLSDRISMIPPITKEEFIESLDVFLKKNLPFAMVADFDRQVMNMVLSFMKIRFSKEILNQFTQKGEFPKNGTNEIKKTTSNSLSEMSLDDIRTVLRQIWKDVLGYSEISDEANFFDIGGDSISAVKLTHLAKIQLQTDIEVADLYSRPTIMDLSFLIDSKINNEEIEDEISRML